CAANWYYFDYG
nr:immunoglobulin heavy chain junction region [Mus musculus]